MKQHAQLLCFCLIFVFLFIFWTAGLSPEDSRESVEIVQDLAGPSEYIHIHIYIYTYTYTYTYMYIYI